MTRRAIDFLIWRAGESVGWDCNAQDIADELGISNAHVARVCNEKDWDLLGERQGQHNGDRIQVDTLIQRPWLGKSGLN